MVLCLRKIFSFEENDLKPCCLNQAPQKPRFYGGVLLFGGQFQFEIIKLLALLFFLLSVPFHPMSQRTTYFGRKNGQVNLLECLTTCKGKILRKRPENILPQLSTPRVFSDLTAIQSLSERHYFFSRRLMLDVLVLV